MSEKRQVIKTTGWLSLLTLLSRFTGLARDIVLAAKLGNSLISDIFYLAFELSNLARRVLGEGALSAFIVPLFVERRKSGDREAWAFTNRAMNTIGAFSLLLTLAGMLFATQVFNLFGGIGLAAGAEKNGLAPPEIVAAVQQGTSLTRLMFPNLVALAVGSIMMGVCNALGSFTAPAMGSVVLNITMIVAGGLALAMKTGAETAAVWLGWSVLAGAGLRMFIMVPPLARAGWSWRPDFSLRDSSLRELYRMMGGGLFGMSINQINMTVVGFFATYLGPGGKTYLVYSNRLIQFPMALTATAMATAMLPQITHYVRQEKHTELRELLGLLKRIELALILPSALGLMFFARPIVELVFQRGEWTQEASAGAAWALFFSAPALLPFGWSRLVLPLFYARKDVRTPVLAAVAAMIVNVVLDVIFTFFTPLGVGGLACAASFAAFVNYAVLVWYLNREPSRPLSDPTALSSFIKCFAAGTIAIGGSRLLYNEIEPGVIRFLADHLRYHGATLSRGVLLLPIMFLAVCVYFALLRLFRMQDSERVMELVLRKLRRKRTAP